MKPLLIALLAGLLLASCAPSLPSKDAELADRALDHANDDSRRRASDHVGTGPLGGKANPIKCDGTEGITEYLGRLRGPQGQVVTGTEAGSGGIGPFGSLVIIYEVEYNTPQGPNKAQLYFDTDFPEVTESRAAAGFSIR